MPRQFAVRVAFAAATAASAAPAACSAPSQRAAARRPPPAVAVVVAPAPRLEPVGGQGSGSTIVLARLGERRLALVADADGHALRLLDTHTGRELPQVDLSGAPSQIVVSTDGRVFVAVRDRAEVDVLEPAPAVAGAARNRPPFRVAARVATADEPVALALTPDGRTLLVASGWGRALDAFSTRSLAHLFRAPLAREPRAVVASADGARVYVAHAAASVVTAVDLVSPTHEVAALRLEQPDPDREGHLLAWRQGYALVRAEGGLVAPGVMVNTGDPRVQTGTYGGVDEASLPAETFALAHLPARAPPAPPREDGARLAASPPVTLPPMECLLPRAAAYDPQSRRIFVVCQGTDRVARIDARAQAPSPRVAEWRAGGEATGLALDPERRTVFVWAQASRTVTAFAMDAYPAGVDRPGEDYTTFALGPSGAPDANEQQLALGRELFHRSGDARIASDGRACASCHPEGRDDGLVWATPDGPRQTPSLAGRLAGTAPYGWSGARATVKQHVANTLRRLDGVGLDDASMNALVAYCMAMAAPPRPSEGDTASAATKKEDPLVAEGRDLFESSRAGCSSCHIDDGTFTDGNRHDVRSRAPGDPRRSFDTPSLRFVGGTAPYFHDGRYPTLRALLVASDGKMGHTAQLSPHELDALDAYLRTL